MGVLEEGAGCHQTGWMHSEEGERASPRDCRRWWGQRVKVGLGWSLASPELAHGPGAAPCVTYTPADRFGVGDVP